MLLGGPAKAGKTTNAVMTSPKPVFVFNTDGRGALDPVVALGGEFEAEDITSEATFDRALTYVKAHKKIRTVVFDNLTIYASIVEKEVRKETRDDPRVIYPEFGRRFMRAFHELLNLPCHLILIGHLEPGENNTPGGFGHGLSIPGKAKTQISALIQDWVWIEPTADPGGNMRWEFLLAPQGNWNKGVRSIQGAKRMPADVAQFIRLMEAGGPQKPKAITKPDAKLQVQPKPSIQTKR